MPPKSEAPKVPRTPPRKPGIAPPEVKARQIPVGTLIPSPDNPRAKHDGDAIKALACSFASVGVLQPLLARPHPKQKGKYDLRAGSRRLAAAKTMGMEFVPVIVREMTDAEAIEITVTENLNREDLLPLEQGRGIATLLSAGVSADDVALKLGRSTGWVLRHAVLTNLHKRFVDLHTKAGHPFAEVPVGVLIQLARLPQEVQYRMAGNISKSSRFLPTWALSVGDCREHIDRIVTMDLRRIPWQIDDNHLYPKAGSCTDCPKRSIREPKLFDDLAHNGKPGDLGRCLDASCFNEKHRRTIKEKVAKAKVKHGNLLLISNSVDPHVKGEAAYFGQTVVKSYSVTKVKKGAKGAVAAVTINGKGAGTTTYVRPPTVGPGSTRRTTGQTMTMAQKRKGLQQRRKAWLIDHMAEVVQERIAMLVADSRPKFLTTGLFADHLADLGVAFLMPEPDDFPCGGPAAWARLELYYKSGPNGVKAQENATGTAILQTWAGRLQRPGQLDLDKYDEDLKRMAKYLDVDLAKLRLRSAIELPEPKSWANPTKPKAVKKTKARKK